jgi:hypothetical protein
VDPEVTIPSQRGEEPSPSHPIGRPRFGPGQLVRSFGWCPMCGEDDPLITYTAMRYNTCWDRDPLCSGEHFHVTCRRCGYEWRERS